MQCVINITGLNFKKLINLKQQYFTECDLNSCIVILTYSLLTIGYHIKYVKFVTSYKTEDNLENKSQIQVISAESKSNTTNVHNYITSEPAPKYSLKGS